MLAIHSLFKEVAVTFSHFAKLGYRAVVCDKIDEAMIVNGLRRNVAWSCPTNFPGIDVIIPCLVKVNGSRRYGYIGVQFKNHNTSSMKSPDEKMRSIALTEEVGADVINVCNIVIQMGKPTEYSVEDQRTAQQKGEADVFIGRDSQAKRQRSSGTRTEPADERIMLWKSRNILACISSSYREHLQDFSEDGDGSSGSRPLPLTLYILGMESFTALLAGSSSVSNILNDLLLMHNSMVEALQIIMSPCEDIRQYHSLEQAQFMYALQFAYEFLIKKIWTMPEGWVPEEWLIEELLTVENQ